jgi:hypothetical protein
MPDPAKSVGDIDDVLSSIRRLVAEQPGPKWQGKDGGPDGVVRPSADDRLVLTPALRVTESDTPPDDTNPDDATPEDTPSDVARTYEAPAPAEPVSENEVTTGPGLEAEGPGDDHLHETGSVAQDVDDDPDTSPELQPEPERMDEKSFVPEVPEDESDAAMEEASALLDAPFDAPSDAPAMDESVAARSEPASAETPDDVANDAHAPDLPQEAAVAPSADETTVAVPLAEADQDMPETDTEDAAPRVVGDDGWRPEMRLFDWDASAGTQPDASAPLADTTAEFESETGDSNWPDATAERAVLDLAAVRDGETAEASDTSDLGSAAAAVAGFTPIFSRRANAQDTQGIPRSADDFGDASTEDAPAAPETAADDAAEQLSDPVGTPAEAASTTNADTAHTDAGADTFQLFDDATLGDAAASSDDADATSVAFSSVREAQPALAGSDAPGETALTEADPDATPEVEPDDADVPPVAHLTALAGGAAHDGVPDDGSQAEVTNPDETSTKPLDLGALEEEVLRRIVAEAVREELQGALGERITRNVRKLVRREIRLVLAVDELD